MDSIFCILVHNENSRLGAVVILLKVTSKSMRIKAGWMVREEPVSYIFNI